MNRVFHPYFSLRGHFDPDEITRLLETQPSSVKRIGDPGPPDAFGPRLGAEWTWQPEDDDSDDVGDHIAYLAGALSSKRERVAELSKKFFGTFHVYNQVDRANRNWFLSAEALRLIADLHVAIGCENVLTQEAGIGADAN
jgi:hypothetical protein